MEEEIQLIDNIGEYLKSKREINKIPISAVAQHLKIKPELVHSLESNDFDRFPAPTYVKGFLRNYSNLVGIDPEPVLNAYKRYFLKEEIDSNIKEPIVKSGQSVLNKINFKFIGVAVLVVFAVFVIIWGLSYSIKFIKNRPGKPVDIITEDTIKQEQPEKEVKELVLPDKVKFPILLSIESLDSVFVRVYADNILMFEDVLKPGETKDWEVQDNVKMRIGVPANLNISLNKQYNGIIRENEPITLIIDQESVRIQNR